VLSFEDTAMTLTLRVERFDPGVDSAPRFQEYGIEAGESDRVLDLLIRVQTLQDGTLSFRKSCAHGVCGSDAMIINGVERLACKTLVRDVAKADGDVITVQPLKALPVQRDLMVDQSAFFEAYRSVKPFLINEEPVPEKERIQLPAEREKFDDATNCILCASCYSACPVIREDKYPAGMRKPGMTGGTANEAASGGEPGAAAGAPAGGARTPGVWGFLGPAAIVQAARFLDDSRDRGFEDRLGVLDAPNGVWPCENHFRCTVVCPRGIKVTKLINLTKRKVKGHGDTKP
jgi:succinate dehydrogenase / fumarate reductase iron-sulfur subunit